MNVVLIVVDSLRASSLGRAADGGPRTPFLDQLARESLAFRRAHATECWTLPAHLSMFTGLLPSEHGGHFQQLAYLAPNPTLAELLSNAGHHTEVITRNSLFDGTLPGVTRGFRRNTRVLADVARAPGLGLLVALSKPRIRRLIRDSGFFHAFQRENRAFIGVLARMIVPADREALRQTLERMASLRRERQPFFLFVNLYDVHAPYAPTAESPLRSFRSLNGWIENCLLPGVSVRLGAHGYLREDFRFSPRVQRMLLARYHAAIELMDAKLADFYADAKGGGLLDDTMLIVTSDHGEAFGDHDLYFHDASVYQTHLHVPLFVRHPEVGTGVADEVVTTRDLFHLIRDVALEGRTRGTLLDRDARAQNGVALSEHFYYPHMQGARACYRQNLASAVVGLRKLTVRREGTFAVDLARDPGEQAPEPMAVAEFLSRCRRDGASPAAVAHATAHLERWHAQASAS
jgi:arylsulfatase A-like enzyme